VRASCPRQHLARVSETLTLPRIRQNVFDRLLVVYVIRAFQELNYPSCGMGILPVLYSGRARCPPHNKIWDIFLFGSPLGSKLREHYELSIKYCRHKDAIAISQTAFMKNSPAA
jgi:hypothetical protein